MREIRMSSSMRAWRKPIVGTTRRDRHRESGSSQQAPPNPSDTALPRRLYIRCPWRIVVNSIFRIVTGALLLLFASRASKGAESWTLSSDANGLRTEFDNLSVREVSHGRVFVRWRSLRDPGGLNFENESEIDCDSFAARDLRHRSLDSVLPSRTTEVDQKEGTP